MLLWYRSHGNYTISFNTINLVDIDGRYKRCGETGRRSSNHSVSMYQYSGYCSPETRSRVDAALLNWGLFPIAWQWITFKTVQHPGIGTNRYHKPFFTTIARGGRRGQSSGYTVIFCNTDESVSKEQMYVHMLLEKGWMDLACTRTKHNRLCDLIQKHTTPL